MSLANENLAAIKRSRQYMRDILPTNKQTFRNMSKEEFESWRLGAYSCLRHFPGDYQLDQLYKEVVCLECGQPVEFHKSCCTNKGGSK